MDGMKKPRAARVFHHLGIVASDGLGRAGQQGINAAEHERGADVTIS
jgi:hypothetical protein